MGQRIGHYEIQEELGRGGMGEVYRATDTKLNRDVALKILPQVFAQDSQRMARFEREAQVLASLNHPNIAQIYGFADGEGLAVRGLVLELVEGETLQARISRGPIPAGQALRLALQICEGLEAAHEKGIIHRDLKPANIKITPEGQVKILDFGLAKAMGGEVPASELSHSPTISHMATQAGVILGTASYMSPEQARGQPVDKRTDIWAFGCVLYEMLTGRRTFEGDTVAEVIASVLKGEPDWEGLPGNVPWGLERVIQRCLRKDPRSRLRDVGDALVELEDALEGPQGRGTAPESQVTEKPTAWRLTLPWFLAAIMTVLLCVALWSLWNVDSSRTREPHYLTVDLPALPYRFDVSPDGQSIVFVTLGQQRLIFHRQLNRRDTVPIYRSDENVNDVFFSPDSKWIGFNRGGRLRKLSLQGGAAVTICDLDSLTGAAWGPDGTIVIGRGRGLLKVSANGGEPESITSPDFESGETGHILPEILPNGMGVLFSIQTAGKGGQISGGSGIGVLRFETGEYETVLESGARPRFATTGHLLYVDSGDLMAVPFDSEALKVTGDPVLVIEDPQFAFGSGFSLSQTGTLVYLSAEESGLRLVRVDRNGDTQSMGLENRLFYDPRFSPDGRRLAVGVVDPSRGNSSIWIYDVERSMLTPLTFGPDDWIPVWTPDGKRVTYSSGFTSGNAQLFSVSVDGGGGAEQLTEGQIFSSPLSWSINGMLVYSVGAMGQRDIWILAGEGDREPEPLLNTEFDEGTPMFSPDGRWLAYSSNRSGRQEIYLTSYPLGDRPRRVSTEGGMFPTWGPAGKELFYRIGEKMMVAPIQTDPTLNVGEPQPLIEPFYGGGAYGLGYDVSPDGTEFVMLSTNDPTSVQLNIVTNFHEELKRLCPSGK